MNRRTLQVDDRKNRVKWNEWKNNLNRNKISITFSTRNKTSRAKMIWKSKRKFKFHS